MEGESAMTIPKLTDEQRREALEKAKIARAKRAQVKQDLIKGKLSLEELLDTEDKALKRMKVIDVIKCAPRYGNRKAEALMEKCGISSSRRIGGLGQKQKERLLKFI